jgi:hypothetical protein
MVRPWTWLALKLGVKFVEVWSAEPGLADLCAELKFLNRINLICPVQPHLQKDSRSRLTQITSRTPASRPTEGRIAIVTDAGRDAVDAAASGAQV